MVEEPGTADAEVARVLSGLHTGEEVARVPSGASDEAKRVEQAEVARVPSVASDRSDEVPVWASEAKRCEDELRWNHC